MPACRQTRPRRRQVLRSDRRRPGQDQRLRGSRRSRAAVARPDSAERPSGCAGNFRAVDLDLGDEGRRERRRPLRTIGRDAAVARRDFSSSRPIRDSPASPRPARRAVRGSACGSRSMPRSPAATSIMFSATTVGRPSLEHLADEIQIALEVARVDDAEHGVGRRRVGAAAEQHVDGHHFVGRPRGQAVGARAGRRASKRAPAVMQRPDLLLDRHARIVADLLPHAGRAR